MVYNGKAYQNSWFGGLFHLWSCWDGSWIVALVSASISGYQSLKNNGLGRAWQSKQPAYCNVGGEVERLSARKLTPGTWNLKNHPLGKPPHFNLRGCILFFWWLYISTSAFCWWKQGFQEKKGACRTYTVVAFAGQEIYNHPPYRSVIKGRLDTINWDFQPSDPGGIRTPTASHLHACPTRPWRARTSVSTATQRWMASYSMAVMWRGITWEYLPSPSKITGGKWWVFFLTYLFGKPAPFILKQNWRLLKLHRINNSNLKNYISCISPSQTPSRRPQSSQMQPWRPMYFICHLSGDGEKQRNHLVTIQKQLSHASPQAIVESDLGGP